MSNKLKKFYDKMISKSKNRFIEVNLPINKTSENK